MLVEFIKLWEVIYLLEDFLEDLLTLVEVIGEFFPLWAFYDYVSLQQLPHGLHFLLKSNDRIDIDFVQLLIVLIFNDGDDFFLDQMGR